MGLTVFYQLDNGVRPIFIINESGAALASV
jgi:hypothetical protein